ncbi:single-stranded-DNA-specific exonuclease RecJ [TM7 phylum sp. oral taxon 350]|nr:single-stranded-DNA-specific exonuclease RecJ [TM7 phylum sp. oral taxon 350]
MTSKANDIFDQLLKSRKINDRDSFLHPKYQSFGDVFLLPDMEKAVKRIKEASLKKQKIVIYGDYDIDGLSASCVLYNAFEAFGFKDVEVYIPNRFIEGYGLTIGSVDRIKEMQADLIVTVDTGSLSHKEVDHANSLGIDVIITDHHNVADQHPKAIAVINPKRKDHSYPYRDFAGVGVAFKLVQALMTELKGLDNGQEKWLLDFVALGTVCDIVPLSGENRMLVSYGLKVLKVSKREGIKALIASSGIDLPNINTFDIGFKIGPRLNATGRLKTARLALDILLTKDLRSALDMAEELNNLNNERKLIQEKILKQAEIEAEKQSDLKVLVVSQTGWNHGVIGIVASKLVEEFKKPTYILEEMAGGLSKGSARSYGDFSVGEGIKYASRVIEKGGGHKLAAGVTLKTDNIPNFRNLVNEYYETLKLKDQEKYLIKQADLVLESLEGIDLELLNLISDLEPFGNENSEPVFEIRSLRILKKYLMGKDKNHVRYLLQDKKGNRISAVKFNFDETFIFDEQDTVDIRISLLKNEWKDKILVNGMLYLIVRAKDCENP